MCTLMNVYLAFVEEYVINANHYTLLVNVQAFHNLTDLGSLVLLISEKGVKSPSIIAHLYISPLHLCFT